MYKIKEEIKQLRSIIFDILNFTNTYILVLDKDMTIKFVNDSLANDLGFEQYNDIIGHSWLDFLEEKEKKIIKLIHCSVALGVNNWEEKYKEVQNTIVGKNGERHCVQWINSHINTNYNWSFSFGMKKKNESKISMNDIREHYKKMINNDRIMINSIKDVMGLKNEIIDTCNINII